MSEAEQWAQAHGFEMVSERDLEWWLDLADDLEWRWAKTYAEHTPHWYLLRHETHLSRKDYERAHRVIVTFGRPEKFWRHTNIYLHNRAGDMKWWVMGPEKFNHQSLINKGSTSDVYGTQDAPKIASSGFTVFDAVASDYDRVFDKKRDHRALWEAAMALPLNRDERPDILDIGAGTGRTIATRIASDPMKYTGVDPSLAMLNQIVLNYWHFKDLRCQTAADFLASSDRRYDTVTVLGDTAKFLSDDELHGVIARADRQALVEITDMEAWVAAYPKATMVPLSDSTLVRIEVEA